MNPQFEDTLTKIAGAVLELRARCDALEAVLRAVAAKTGIDHLRVAKAIQSTTQIRHQQLLEQGSHLILGLRHSQTCGKMFQIYRT